MARPKSTKPTVHELTILRVLWGESPLSISEILERLPKKPKPSYSSLLTIVRIMDQKGFVKHEKQGKAFFYTPLLKEEKYIKLETKSLADTMFGGSRFNLAVNIIKKEKLKPEEIKSLKKLLEEL